MSGMTSRSLRGLRRVVLFLGQAALIVFATLILAGAFHARGGPDLDLWHETTLASEFRAGGEVATLEDYLQVEQRVFDELDTEIISRVRLNEADELNRYARGSRSFPERDGRNWNRTQVLVPEVVRGAVLMIHGMTDSPYSMRHFAELLFNQGYYVLNLRMPGHGTVPGGLAHIDWQDWAEAVNLGARHVESMIGPDQPFLVMGYSNGGSLAVNHTLDSMRDLDLRIPDQLILVSPMIGVSALARFSKVYYWLGQIEFFHKSQWLEVLPEYDPHKYNSFPMNGPRQSRAMTERVAQRIRQMSASGEMSIMPPILTFQSLVDSTVVTDDLIGKLYDYLPVNGSELVLFDVNRAGVLEYFVAPRHEALLHRLEHSAGRDYRLTLISNRSERTQQVSEFTGEPHKPGFTERKLPLQWPQTVFSLSHVALPFPPGDPVYGFQAVVSSPGFPAIGKSQLTGESGALTLPPSLFTRIRSNPFHSYVEERILETVRGPGGN